MIRQFGEKLSGVNYILRPGGYIVIKNSDGKVGVISTAQGYFLPGGGQDHEESPAEAAVREAKEECGLQIEIVRMISMADEFLFAASEERYYCKRCTFFSARLIEQNPGGEVNHRLLWMTADEAASTVTHQSQRWAILMDTRVAC